MSTFFIEQDKTRITFPDAEWCDIKTEFTQEDLDYITNALMHARFATDGKQKPETEIAMQFGKQATLERAIVDWSFVNGSGTKVPITPESISNLRSKYRWFLLKEIDRLNQEAGAFLKN